MRPPSPPKNANETQETEKAPFLVVNRARDAILDQVFKAGDHLGELELHEVFVSWKTDLAPISLA